jgi:hypothetical protein
MGLGADFEAIHTLLLHGSSNYPVPHSVLAASRRYSGSRGPHSVLAASQRYSGSRWTSSDPCEHYKKTTHWLESCFEKFSGKLADFHAHQAARGHGTRSAPRGLVATATSPSADSSSSWVLDSGASFHVTYNQSKLASSKPILDGVQFRLLMVYYVTLLMRVPFVILIFLFLIFSLYLSCLWIFSQ